MNLRYGSVGIKVTKFVPISTSKTENQLIQVCNAIAVE